MDIKISKAKNCCTGTEAPFEHGEGVMSLVRLQEGELVREDYKESAWHEEFRKEAYSLWKTTYYDPHFAEGEDEEVFSPLRKLFYDMADAESREQLAMAFLAAQLLRRQKVFRLIKEADAEEGKARLTLYTDRIGNRMIEVRDPNFSYAELEVAQAELLKFLRATEEPAAAEVEDAKQPEVTEDIADTPSVQDSDENTSEDEADDEEEDEFDGDSSDDDSDDEE